MMNNKQEHWETVYSTKEPETLGWYEKVPERSLEFLEKAYLPQDAAILDVGAGASAFIDAVLEKGFKTAFAVDISKEALDKTRDRLKGRADNVKWFVEDIARPEALAAVSMVDFWHDRAVLHFLVEEREQEVYVTHVKRLVKVGGYVAIAVFALDGADKCSGLPVKRYDEKMISSLLGESFELVEFFYHTYYTPSGAPRPYVYTMYRRMR